MYAYLYVYVYSITTAFFLFDQVQGCSDVGDADVVNITAIEVLEGNEIVEKSISRSIIVPSKPRMIKLNKLIRRVAGMRRSIMSDL
mgnify:CR=1 FL=1